MLFWRVVLGLAVVGFLLSLIFPQLHPYDQLLLFGFSLCFVLPEARLERRYVIIVLVVMLVMSFLAVAMVRPALSNDDLAVIYWIRDHIRDSTVLANPEISGAINTLLMSPSIRTEFDLFLECIPDSTRWERMYHVLKTSDPEEARNILGRYGVDYVVVDARDVWNYGFDTDKFSEIGTVVFSSGDSQIYEVA